MDKPYDCTGDVLEHRRQVQYWIDDFAHVLMGRAMRHDESKLSAPEKAIFDEFTPKLQTVEYGSDEYAANLKAMGDGLAHHYQVNRHHPQHFANGVNGMTLHDLVEMFCDWLAAAARKKQPLDVDAMARRFNLEPQLVEILLNTMREIDFWCDVNGVPVVYFTPEKYRKPYKLD